MKKKIYVYVSSVTNAFLTSSHEYAYDENTTFIQMLEDLKLAEWKKEDCLLYVQHGLSISDDNNNFFPVYWQEPKFDFIIIDGKAHWNVSILKCHLVDYINTFNLKNIYLNYYKDGGVEDFLHVSEGFEQWDSIVENLDKYLLMSGVIDTKTKSKVLKSIRKQPLVTTVRYDQILHLARYRRSWDLNEFAKLISLGNDLDLACFILKLCGFIQDVDDGKFYPNRILYTSMNYELTVMIDELEKRLFEEAQKKLRGIR